MNIEFRQKPITLKTALMAVVIGIALGTVFVFFGGFNVLEVYSTLARGAFGSNFAWSSTVRWMTPMLICGIASGIAFRGGMFNMGTEGQLYMGAMASAICGFSLQGLPAVVHIPLCILSGMAAGALYAMIPAILRVYWNTSEIVVTLMLNYIAIYLTDFLVSEYFLTTGSFGDSLTTDQVYPSAMFPDFGDTPITFALLLGLLLVALFWLFFGRSRRGFEIHVAGLNPEFARYSGISVSKVRLQVMLLSCAVAGLAGATEILGISYRFLSNFSPDYGPNGMLVALLGNSTAPGILLASLFMGALKAGSLTLERSAGVSRALAVIIQALVICFISTKVLDLKLRKKKSAGGDGNRMQQEKPEPKAAETEIIAEQATNGEESAV